VEFNAESAENAEKDSIIVLENRRAVLGVLCALRGYDNATLAAR
jgi:hypothetical protein